MKRIVLLLALLIMPAFAMAQESITANVQYLFPDSLKASNINVNDILVEGDTLWVATVDSGLMRSPDNGQSWQFIQNNLDWWAHWSGAVMRIPGTRILLVGTENGLFRSTDNGAVWTQPSPPPPYGPWFASSGMVVTCFLAQSDSSVLAGGSYGIIRSTNDGLSWQTVFYDSTKSWNVSAFALNPETGTLFASTNQYGTGILSSTDGGMNWRPSANGIDYPSVQSLAVDGDGTMYAGTGNYHLWQGDGLYKSTDDGANWTKITAMPSQYQDVAAVLVVKPNLIFVGFDGSNPAESGVFRYDGSSWTQISTTAFSYVFSLAAQGNDLLVGTPDGLYRVSNVLTAVHKEPLVTTTFSLSQNYPNPFNPTTSILYSVSSRSHVTLTVYNVLGQKVATLVDGEKAPGSYTAIFDGSRYPSGAYLYRIQAGNNVETKKMILIK